MSNDDEILEFLVQKVEETGVSPSVTLTIGGLVIVGGLVRSKLYMIICPVGSIHILTNRKGEQRNR
jgi:hypothetical protein